MNVNVVCPHCLKVNRIPKKASYAKANCGSCKNSLLDSKPVSVDANKLGTFIANSEIPVVVDFWAPWCGPCRMIAPVIEELAEEFDGKAKICKVNTDEEQDIAIKFGIRSIPTLIFLKDGEIVDQVIGAQSKQVLADKLNSILG